VRTLIPPPP